MLNKYFKIKSKILSKTKGVPIFCVTMQKSGTIFLQRISYHIYGLSSIRFSYGDIYNQVIDYEELKKKVYNKKVFCKSHIPATKYNVECLERSGIKKIVLQLRHPIDSLISWHYHVLNENFRKDEDSVNLHKISGLISENHYELKTEEQKNWLIENYFPKQIKWLKLWNEYYLRKDRSVDIKICKYEDLQENSLEFLKNIFNYFGYDFKKLKNKKKLLPDHVKFNFRLGRVGEYKKELNINQIHKLETQISEIKEIIKIINY